MWAHVPISISVSWLAKTPSAALAGIRRMVAKSAADMRASGESMPPSLTLAQRLARFDPARHIGEW